MIAKYFHRPSRNISYIFISEDGYFIISLLTESEEPSQSIETNETDDKALSAEQLDDGLAEEVEKEVPENVSTTEDSVSDSAISTEQSEESLVKAE